MKPLFPSVLDAYRSSNFAPAFLFLSPARRRALKAVYAFCREVDDIADKRSDNVSDPAAECEKARSALDAWRRLLRDPFDVLALDRVNQPVWTALSEAAEQFSLQVNHLVAVVDGVEMDLTQRRYRSFEDLKPYCHGVASSVGLACLPIFGLNEREHRDFAVNLGIGVQLTNILRDLGSDAERDRVYLPQEDLRRFGYTEDELKKGVYNEAYVRLMRFEVGRAREYYALAACALPAASRRRARPALVMARLYHALLAEIERKHYEVFSRKISLSPWRKAICVVGSLLKN